MSTFTVTTTPQPIYPDGLQDSFVIKNLGPYTIYVDSDGSVSTNSLPIPPTGVVAWDSLRPLWVVGSDAYRDAGASGVIIDSTAIQSTVVIVRNSGDPTYSNLESNVIFSGSGKYNPSALTWRTQSLDTSAYQSIQLALSSPDVFMALGADVGTASWVLTLKWIDRSGNILSTDTYRAPPQSQQTAFGNFAPFFDAPQTYANTTAIKITTKVKGYGLVVAVRLLGGSTGNEQFTLNIRGVSIDLPDKMTFTSFDSLPHMTPQAAASNFNLFSIDRTGFSFDWGTAGSNYADLLLPCLSPTLKIHMFCAALNNSPSYYFSESHNTNLRTGPTVNPTVDSETTITGLPMGIATRVRWNVVPTQAGPVNAANCYMRFTWVI